MNMTEARGRLADAELSDREAEVLTRVSYGRSNTEIGRDLYISTMTVKSHLARIFAKLGARDRAHAVAIAFRKGMIQ